MNWGGRIGIYRVVENQYQYELTDHLGNVRAVISGIKVSGRADVLEYADYYALGGVARSGGTMRYRHGYQGQYAEKDKETEWNSFELRQYDAVTGRWLSPDPYGQYDSPYVGMGDDWTNQADPDGGGIGAAVGFGAGAVVGAIKDPDNWLQYGLAGAAGGFLGGGLSGSTVRADNNPGGKFSAGGGSHGMTLAASTSTTFSMGSIAGASSGLARGLGGLQDQDIARFFPMDKESDAYRYMWKKSFVGENDEGKPYTETAAWLTDKGVLVLPRHGIDQRTGKPDRNDKSGSNFFYLPVDKNQFVTYKKARYKIIGSIHTHPNRIFGGLSGTDGGMIGYGSVFAFDHKFLHYSWYDKVHKNATQSSIRFDVRTSKISIIRTIGIIRKSI